MRRQMAVLSILRLSSILFFHYGLAGQMASDHCDSGRQIGGEVGGTRAVRLRRPILLDRDL
jgi:hypothetical protein